MTVTIKDVALRAGVSPKTVSRVMNGEPHVRPAVREAVMHVVEALGYRPNAFARSLSSARSYVIALFSDDPGSGYAIAMQRGALDRCRAHHYHLLVEPLDLRDRWDDALTDLAQALRPDGAILAPPLSQDTVLLDRLAALGLPYVRVSPGTDPDARAGTIAIDERRAAFDMTARLIALGHRDIAFVEGNPAHASTGVRRAGFVAAMAEAGLAIAAGRILPGDFSFRSGLEAGEAVLAYTPRPSAVFASNDDMALGVSVTALKHGVAIPDALSVAGFDDAPTARLAWPPISTVRQPVAELGAAAVEMLVDPQYRDAMDAPRFRRLLDYDLVERGSTAAYQGTVSPKRSR